MLEALSGDLSKKNKTSEEPKVFVSESDENYKVQFSLTGLNRENLLVSINERGNLNVFLLKDNTKKSGKRSGKISNKDTFETFQKEIPIPEYVDTGFTSASCHAGTLTVFFTKANQPVAKRPYTIVVY
jgi:HSP20 family molecular chaperone IbpA